MTYAGVTNVQESQFWQVVKECPQAMHLYNTYIHVVKKNEGILERYQSIISYRLARLNYLMKLVDERNTKAYTILL